MKRYLITTKDVSGFTESDATKLADSKNSALDLLSLISNNNDDELISVIEVDVYSAQATLLEPFLNKKFKLDLREKQ
ncbi:hypothetical protein ACIQ1H_09360 [Lysinibacillus sp. NPDC097279]|uniref:hypothetical protein n=1 Tax=Lysinibacillus sp. NPDC097279 TaxID=3364143 RepID=UPI0038021480